MKKANLKKLIPIVTAVVTSLAATISIIYMAGRSIIELPDGGGGTDEELVAYPLYDEKGFLDSELFSNIAMKDAEKIVRFCVIRNQFETNGVYNGRKKIDINAFAERDREIKSDLPKVEYYLDDLLKWGNYGFTIQTVTGTPNEVSTYFNSLKGKNDSTVTNVTGEASVGQSQEASGLESEEIYYDPLWSVYPDYPIDEEAADHMNVLVSRYNTADGKSLIDYADSVKEYNDMVNNLSVSVNDIFHNYMEYSELISIYNPDNTNIRYCVQLMDGSEKLRLSNVTFEGNGNKLKNMTEDELSAYFTGADFRKYICFTLDKLRLKTNISSVSQMTMKGMLNSYKYTYSDGSVIWLGYGTDNVDSNGQVIRDVYHDLVHEYDTDRAVINNVLFFVIAMLILLVIAMVLITVFTDKTLHRVDQLPFEVYILVCIAAFLIVGAAFCGFAWVAFDLYSLKGAIPYLLGVLFALLFDALSLPLYIMLVRRIKCRRIWNGSLCQRFLKMIRRSVLAIYDNGPVVVRSWLPYLLFLMFNLVLVLLGAPGIMTAFCFDMVIGYFIYKKNKNFDTIVDDIRMISEGDTSHKSKVDHLHGQTLILAEAVNTIGDGIKNAVDISLRDERMKSTLITNVSHDIKTPLTSIISYVDLIKRENIPDEKIAGYVDVLDRKAQKLKILINDLVEASKISSGVVNLNMVKINASEFFNQILGEFAEKFEEKKLVTVVSLPEEALYINADGGALYRIMDNLFNNICKYSLEGTRVYMDMCADDDEKVVISLKNISAEILNVNAVDLSERFVRGDESRQTEGSGLGLSIAKSMAEAMGGELKIDLDGDLFKVTLRFERTE